LDMRQLLALFLGCGIGVAPPGGPACGVRIDQGS